MDQIEKSSKDLSKQEIAAEVLELGEMLFDTAIDAAGQRSAGEEGDAAFVEEMRADAVKTNGFCHGYPSFCVCNCQALSTCVNWR